VKGYKDGRRGGEPEGKKTNHGKKQRKGRNKCVTKGVNPMLKGGEKKRATWPVPCEVLVGDQKQTEYSSLWLFGRVSWARVK